VERGITRESLPGQVSGLTSRRANNARPESWTADRIAWRQFDIGHSQGKSTPRAPFTHQPGKIVKLFGSEEEIKKVGQRELTMPRQKFRYA